MSILCENLFLKVIFFLSCCDYFTFFLLTYHQYQILIAFYFVMTDGITEMSYWIISYFPLTVFTKSLYFSMYYLKRVNYLTATTPRSSEGFQHQLICCTRRKAICRAELPDFKCHFTLGLNDGNCEAAWFDKTFSEYCVVYLVHRLELLSLSLHQWGRKVSVCEMVLTHNRGKG